MAKSNAYASSGVIHLHSNPNTNSTTFTDVMFSGDLPFDDVDDRPVAAIINLLAIGARAIAGGVQVARNYFDSTYNRVDTPRLVNEKILRALVGSATEDAKLEGDQRKQVVVDVDMLLSITLKELTEQGDQITMVSPNHPNRITFKLDANNKVVRYEIHSEAKSPLEHMQIEEKATKAHYIVTKAKVNRFNSYRGRVDAPQPDWQEMKLFVEEKGSNKLIVTAHLAGNSLREVSGCVSDDPNLDEFTLHLDTQSMVLAKDTNGKFYAYAGAAFSFGRSNNTRTTNWVAATSQGRSPFVQTPFV
jgi:hypothetical protein